jgi:hypothetical protein
MKKIPTLLDLYKLITENNVSEYKIYCDMDGVLCDFDQGYETLTGMSTEEANLQPKAIVKNPKTNKEEKVSFFWNLFRTKLNEKNIQERDFWANLPKQEKNNFLWDKIEKYNPNILSSPSIDFRLSQDQQLDPKFNQAIQGKKEWINKNLSNVNKEIFVPASQKVDSVAPNHILIDDMQKNIDAWKAAGGKAILHTSASKTIEALKKYDL